MNGHHDEAPAGDAAQGFREQTITNTGSIAQSGLDHLADDRTAFRADIEARDKHITVLRARVRAAGFVFHVLDAGNGASTFMISRWGRTVDLPDAAEVSDWLDRIGAP